MNDEQYMKIAIDLANSVGYQTSPNPSVGCARRPWRLSLPCLNGSKPSHSFVMPIQGVEAGFANGTGLCPFVEYIQYSVLSLRSYE